MLYTCFVFAGEKEAAALLILTLIREDSVCHRRESHFGQVEYRRNRREAEMASVASFRSYLAVHFSWQSPERADVTASHLSHQVALMVIANSLITSRLTRGINTLMFYCWPIVYEVGPTIKQHYINVLC